jgi:hypothetical protein
MDLYVNYLPEDRAWFVMDMEQPNAIEAGPFPTEDDACRWMQYALTNWPAH